MAWFFPLVCSAGHVSALCFSFLCLFSGWATVNECGQDSMGCWLTWLWIQASSPHPSMWLPCAQWVRMTRGDSMGYSVCAGTHVVSWAKALWVLTGALHQDTADSEGQP